MTKSPLVSDLISLGSFVASRKWIIFQNQCFAACDALFEPRHAAGSLRWPDAVDGGVGWTPAAPGAAGHVGRAMAAADKKVMIRFDSNDLVFVWIVWISPGLWLSASLFQQTECLECLSWHANLGPRCQILRSPWRFWRTSTSHPASPMSPIQDGFTMVGVFACQWCWVLRMV